MNDVNQTYDDIASALTVLETNMAYDDWLHVIFAVKSANPGCKHLVQAWSELSKYKHKFESTWNGAKSDGGITAKTLFKMARERGWKPARETKREAWDHNEVPPGTTKVLVATHNYHDQAGKLLYYKKRYNFKDANGKTVLVFKDNEPEGNKPHKVMWFNHKNPATNLEDTGRGKGTPRVIYNLPEVLKAYQNDELIIVVEGEPKADKLKSWGLPATCNDAGATSWNFELLKQLKGAKFVYIPDNDKAGEDGAKKFLRIANEIEATAWIVRLPRLKNPKDDLIQWDGDRDELLALAEKERLDKPNGEELPPEPDKQTGVGDENDFYSYGQFTATATGVIANIKVGKEFIDVNVCSTVGLVARTITATDEGLLLRITGADGVARLYNIYKRQFQMSVPILCESLGRIGLHVNPEQHKLFTRYIFNAKLSREVIIAPKTGWFEQGDLEIFALPTELPREVNGIEVMLDPQVSDEAFFPQGTFEEWQEHVCKVVQLHTYCRVNMYCEFAPPLFRPSGREGSGFHFYASSGTGKSSTEEAVKSGHMRPSPLRSWRQTANGFEAVAELHNDLSIDLDELQLSDVDTLSRNIYELGVGVGKTRMTQHRRSEKLKNWVTGAISTGEKSIVTKLAEGGVKVTPGQLVRFLDIPAPDNGLEKGVFDGDVKKGDVQRSLRAGARKYYGTAMPAFTRRLEALTPEDWQEIEKLVKQRSKQICEKQTGQLDRIADHFAIRCVAGELACEYGVLTWDKDLVLKDMKTAFEWWRSGQDENAVEGFEAVQGVKAVQSFILAHGDSRFDDSTAKPGALTTDVLLPRRALNRVGFYRTGTDGTREFLIEPNAFDNEICKGMNTRKILEYLKAEEILFTNRKGKYVSEVRLAALGKTKNGDQNQKAFFYVITSKIYTWGMREEEQQDLPLSPPGE